MIRMRSPSFSELKGFRFRLRISTESIGDVTESEVVVFFIRNILLKKFPRVRWNLTVKSFSNEVTNR